MAHMVIAEDCIHYYSSPFGICGGRSDSGTGFFFPPEYFKFPCLASFLQHSQLIHSSVINSV